MKKIIELLKEQDCSVLVIYKKVKTYYAFKPKNDYQWIFICEVDEPFCDLKYEIGYLANDLLPDKDNIYSVWYFHMCKKIDSEEYFNILDLFKCQKYKINNESLYNDIFLKFINTLDDYVSI